MFYRLDNRVKIGLASNLRPSSLRDFRLKLEKEVPREEEQDEVCLLLRSIDSVLKLNFKWILVGPQESCETSHHLSYQINVNCPK